MFICFYYVSQVRSWTTLGEIRMPAASPNEPKGLKDAPKEPLRTLQDTKYVKVEPNGSQSDPEGIHSVPKGFQSDPKGSKSELQDRNTTQPTNKNATRLEHVSLHLLVTPKPLSIQTSSSERSAAEAVACKLINQQKTIRAPDGRWGE